MRVTATNEALDFIQLLQKKYGPLLFYQSAGCCDGSSLMCYQEGDFLLGDSDSHIGTIGGTPVYMHKRQLEYWKNTELVIDAVYGRGATFSLDSIEEKHFITRSRIQK